MPSWPRNFKDPIHGLIQFNDERLDRCLLELINTREFQRLRRIKQLGFSDFVFPGASHTRFAHSIGVLHVARLFLEQLKRIESGLVSEEQRTVVLTTALLHDVGHGPFSHTFEAATGDDHEKRILEILRDDSTELRRALRQVDESLPDKLATFLNEDTILARIISSQFDADRSDFLLRDSHATGSGYGRFDLPWMIDHLRFDPETRQFYFPRKALEATEEYLFARYHMYRAVYFHKATRAAEIMLRLILQRYKRLMEEQGYPALENSPVPEAPRAMYRAFGRTPSLNDYLALDDHTMTEFLKACENSGDAILSSLGAGLTYRHLYKCVDATDAAAGQMHQFTIEASELLRSRGRDPNYTLVIDTPADIPYELPYVPDPEEPAQVILIERSTGEHVEISAISDPVDQLRKTYTLIRYYFPEDLRGDIDAIAGRTLRR